MTEAESQKILEAFCRPMDWLEFSYFYSEHKPNLIRIAVRQVLSQW